MTGGFAYGKIVADPRATKQGIVVQQCPVLAERKTFLRLIDEREFYAISNFNAGNHSCFFGSLDNIF